MGSTIRFVVSVTIVLSSAWPALAQCSGEPRIQNLRISHTPTAYTLTWDAPAGIANPVYEILETTQPAYCPFPQDTSVYDVIGTTTATSFTAMKSVPESAYLMFIRVQGNPCVTSTVTVPADTFSSVPTKPMVSSTSATGGQVRVSFNYSDTKTVAIWLYRVADQKFITATGPCAADPKVLVDSNPPGSGTHEYRLIAYNTGNTTGLSGVVSDPIQVTIGTAPPKVSFSATPRLIRAGESARLVWRTSGASTVSISGLGSRPSSGSEVVSPAQTTVYTLTASNGSGSVTDDVTIEVITSPVVTLSALPEAMVQGTSGGGATTSFVLQNSGGGSTTISLTQQGDFFTQEPTSFVLAPGASQRVTITAAARQTGAYRGSSIVSGSGVPPGMTVPIRLLAAPTPTGRTGARPSSLRIDVAAPQGADPVGSVNFINTGDTILQGALVSTVPWLIPQDGLIEASPGQSVEATFTVDRSRRPAGAQIGSVEGVLKLVFRSSGGAKNDEIEPKNGVSTSTSLVTVVDTSRPEVTPGQIPPLRAGETALFIPGAGHVEGGTGLFFSDIALVNLDGNAPLEGIDLYYTPTSGGQTLGTSVSTLASGTPLVLADIVSTVFEAEATLGSLQIRGANLDRLGVNANILLRTRGENQQFFGNTIPALRSDRSAGPGESMFITGLTSTETSYTNLFIQETAGGQVSVDLEFLDESGQTLGVREDVVVEPFRLVGLFHSNAAPTLPAGAVSVVITSSPNSTGSFGAYATPVDGRSGDSWSLVDWNAVQGFSGSEDMVIPVAGAVLGGNNLYFRTDLSIVNRADEPASGVLKYIPRPVEGRAPIERVISLGARQSDVLEDITSTLFGIDPISGTVGYFIFTPTSGTMTVTSRNFATEGDDPGTFGTGVPTLSRDSSLRLGDVRRIGSVKDASLETFTTRVPGSYRSNFGIMETSGTSSVTVRVTVYFTFASGATAVTRGSGSKEYTLQPNEFMQIGRVSREILGESRENYGDFDNLQVEFAVIDGDGAAAVYVSSVENDSGDSTLRVE